MQHGRWFKVGLLVVSSTVVHGQTCLPSPEAAAQSIIGAAAQDGTHATGFRVQDVQLDPVMHRVWVRVGRCEAPSAPLILVPLRAVLSGMHSYQEVGPFVPASSATYPAAPLPFSGPAPFRPLAIHAGEAVLVTFASEAVHMELDGTADQPAVLGDTIAVSLRRRGDEPPHRMRGILRADHRVEVQR